MRLKNLVRQNQIRPGRRLMPEDLAERFKVSRTPVREALQRLAAEGLIVTSPSRGQSVKPFDVKEQIDLGELALTISQYAIQKSKSALATKQDFRIDLRAVGELQPEASASLVEDVMVHITNLSGNDAMVHVMGNITDRTHALRIVDMQEAATKRLLLADASKLMSALGERDTQRAMDTLTRQFRRYIDRIPALVEAANIAAAAARFP